MIAFQLFPSQCVVFGIWLNATIITKTDQEPHSKDLMARQALYCSEKKMSLQ